MTQFFFKGMYQISIKKIPTKKKMKTKNMSKNSCSTSYICNNPIKICTLHMFLTNDGHVTSGKTFTE